MNKELPPFNQVKTYGATTVIQDLAETGSTPNLLLYPETLRIINSHIKPAPDEEGVHTVRTSDLLTALRENGLSEYQLGKAHGALELAFELASSTDFIHNIVGNKLLTELTESDDDDD